MTDPASELEETEWTVVEIGGEPVDSDASRSVSFTAGVASGRVGVNRFSTRYEMVEDTLSVGPIMSTKMAGPLDLMTLEMRFHAAFHGRHPLELAGDDLVIGEGDTSIRLSRRPAS